MTEAWGKDVAKYTRITGEDEALGADVVLEAGLNRLATTSRVTVLSTLGLDNFADGWFDITNAGSIGDTVRVQIAVGASGAAIDVTTTLTATEAGNPVNLATLIIADLTADATFDLDFKASRIADNDENPDNAIVHITSIHCAEFGERPNSNDLTLTTTGTTTVQLFDDVIVRRNKANSLTRDPKDKRIGIFGISGTVVSIPGGISGLFITKALDGASSSNMIVNASLGSPQAFTVSSDPIDDIFIQELRFVATASGIKFGQFLKFNSPLSNGIRVTITSQGETLVFPQDIRTTEDFKHVFSFGVGQGFNLDISPNLDSMVASLIFNTPIVIERASLDEIKIEIRDNLTQGSDAADLLEGIGFGFRREP